MMRSADVMLIGAANNFFSAIPLFSSLARPEYTRKHTATEKTISSSSGRGHINNGGIIELSPEARNSFRY